MPQDDDTDSLRVSWDSRIPTTAALTRPKVERDEPADLYGMHLLLHLASEIKQRVRSRLVIPIAVLGSKVGVKIDVRLMPIPGTVRITLLTCPAVVS